MDSEELAFSERRYLDIYANGADFTRKERRFEQVATDNLDDDEPMHVETSPKAANIPFYSHLPTELEISPITIANKDGDTQPIMVEPPSFAASTPIKHGAVAPISAIDVNKEPQPNKLKTDHLRGKARPSVEEVVENTENAPRNMPVDRADVGGAEGAIA